MSKRKRDRDERGRAQNARPRDGLGRPLPYGSVGVERVDEDMVLEPAESLRQARELFDDGRPFHAHEVLEAAWKSAPDEERGLWKALAQLAVGITHVRRDNPHGSVSLLRRARDGIRPYSDQPPHSIAAGALVEYASTLVDKVDKDGLDGIGLDELTPPLTA